MKILITGSQGYIGTVLSHELSKKGYEIVGLDTLYYENAWLYDLPGYKKPKIIKKDIREINEEDVKGFDAIVHLAELSNDPLGENDPQITYKINHEGTVRLAKLAKKNGVNRFIYFSSCSVYGSSDGVSSEDSPTNPLTAYAKSKVMNEESLLELKDNKFSPIIFRNATVFGASPRLRFDLVVNNLSGLAYTTHEIKMESDGEPWRPLIHILDVCQAVEIALKAPLDKIRGQIVNVGDTSSNYQIKKIAEIIKNTFPGCSVTLNKNGADKRNYRVNFDKIKKILPGFSCKYNVEKGAKELLEIFKKVNLTKEDFLSKDFTRLRQIKFLKESKQIDNDFFWKNKI